MKTLKFLAISLVLLCGTTTLYAQTIDDAAAKYTEGVEKLKAKDFAASAALLEEGMDIGFELGDEGLDIVKEIQSLLPKVYLQAGVGALKAQNYDSALKELNSAYELADLYGDVTTARQAGRMISGAYQMQGATAFNEKDYATALESFSKGYEIDHSNIKLALLTAKTYAELGQLETALGIYSEIIATGQSNSKYEAEAAEAQADVTSYVLVAASAAAEEKDLDKVLELAALAPSSPEVALMSIQVANNLTKYDVIVANAEAAADIQTDLALASDIYYMLGIAQTNLKNYDKAKAALSKVTAGGNVADAKKLISELNK
ncbi:MAG: hypothetical protein R3Y61_00120 [Rikenellaceae bacterium]